MGWKEFAESLPDFDVNSVNDDFDEPEPKTKPRPKSSPEEEPRKEAPAYQYKLASKEVQEVLNSRPKPFIEPPQVEYARDAADGILPSPGFVTDFVNLGRGTESPTLFLVWGALWTLSAALNRCTWLEWYPKKLWPNLYVLFVAPAGLCKKSTPIDFGQALLEESEHYRPNSIFEFENSYRFVTTKASPSGVYMLLAPSDKLFLDGPKIITAHRSSKLTLCISELATLLSKQQYMVGLVDDITNFYDCQDKGSVITRERGVEELENIYVTMAGAITPTGLEESIPPEALKGGLISRMIIAYQDMPTKIYPRPLKLAGYPTISDVAKKLAWISANCLGEYHFTPEAEDAFSEWYAEWKSRIIAGDLSLREDEHRRDTVLRKVSLLLRVAEYRPGNEITLENFLQAKKILDYTLALSSRMMAGLGGNEFAKNLNRVKAYIEKKHSITREKLLNRYGGQIPSAELTILVNQLLDQGAIIGELNGQPILRASGSKKEIYTATTPEDIYATKS